MAFVSSLSLPHLRGPCHVASASGATYCSCFCTLLGGWGAFHRLSSSVFSPFASLPVIPPALGGRFLLLLLYSLLPDWSIFSVILPREAGPPGSAVLPPSVPAFPGVSCTGVPACDCRPAPTPSSVSALYITVGCFYLRFLGFLEHSHPAAPRPNPHVHCPGFAPLSRCPVSYHTLPFLLPSASAPAWRHSWVLLH